MPRFLNPPAGQTTLRDPRHQTPHYAFADWLGRLFGEVGDPSRSMDPRLTVGMMPGAPGPRSVRQLKAPWHMSDEELTQAIQVAKQEEHELAVKLFGPERGREYERLQRAANSSVNLERADEAAKKIEQMESALTKSQRNRLYGIGTPASRTADELAEFRNAIWRVDGRTPEELGESLQWAITKIGKATDPRQMSLTEQVAYAQIRRAYEIARAEGWNLKHVSNAAIRAAAARFKDPEDAAFMLSRWLRAVEHEGDFVGAPGRGGAIRLEKR